VGWVCVVVDVERERQLGIAARMVVEPQWGGAHPTVNGVARSWPEGKKRRPVQRRVKTGRRDSPHAPWEKKRGSHVHLGMERPIIN